MELTTKEKLKGSCLAYEDRLFKMTTKDCRNGFTLIELMIAAAVLSVFMVGVFSIYRSGSRGFIAGSWRAEEQKKAQLFLSSLSRELSMANPGLIRIESDGTQSSVQPTPVYVNNDFFRFNARPAFLNADTKKWTCLFAFSISYPYIAENATFASPIEYGRWSGVSIWVKDRKIRYIRTGDPVYYSSNPDSLPGAVVQFPGPGIVHDSGDFRPDTNQIRTRDFDFSLDQIACVASGTSLANPLGIEVICRFVRLENRRKTEAEIVQGFAVQLASMTSIVTF
jgi:prepilin-type N-terminal cleavage/methylation domain-containing protein